MKLHVMIKKCVLADNSSVKLIAIMYKGNQWYIDLNTVLWTRCGVKEIITDPLLIIPFEHCILQCHCFIFWLCKIQMYLAQFKLNYSLNQLIKCRTNTHSTASCLVLKVSFVRTVLSFLGFWWVELKLCTI